MNKIYLQDTALLAFQPLINLSFSSFANLSSQAPFHWLNSDISPNQWGAFMHFYGPTRRLLKIGGLDLEDENFFNINSSHKKWDFLIAEYLSGNLDIQGKLYLIRLLFYLGFYKQGLQICKKVIVENSDLDSKIWAKYLYSLGESILNPNNWTPEHLIHESDLLNRKSPAFLLFHLYLLFAKFYIRYSDDPCLGKLWLNKASSLIENSGFLTKNDSNLAQLRLEKYKADFYFRIKEPQEAISLLHNICILSDDIILQQDKEPYLYLFKETKRRILDAIVLYYYRIGNIKSAFKYAQESILVDPYCSYAFLLAGELASNIDMALSKSYFEKASEYGILERPYAKQALAKQIQEEFSLKKLDLQTEAFNGNIFLTPQEGSEVEVTYKLPIEMTPLGVIANSYSEHFHWEQIKKTTAYQRSLPFWELKSSYQKLPIFCSEPLVALEVFKNKECPWFKTLYLQRAMPMNFREDLIFAVAPHISFAILQQFKAGQLEILQGRSDRTEMILSLRNNICALPKLERILFCRLIGALGFYEEALKGLPIKEKNASWDFEDEYAFCTKLFFEHIYFAGTDFFSYHDIEFAFEKLSVQPESIRMRLLLTMLGCVYHGKRNCIPLLNKWREKGFQTLSMLQNSKHFDEFEKNLLTSRFYRAVCFYPFLIHDRETLQQEAEICQSYARSLMPQNEKQKLLYEENLFPMLESMARIFDHLGESNKSLNLMEEIVYKVDALDAKAWIQVGEAREKNGNLEKALKAFQIAIELGVPLGSIACYRAGRTCEKLGNLVEAKHYYLRSLKFCPKGLSPLKRLNAISKNLNDLYLKNWSEINLNNLSSHFNPYLK